MIGWFLGTRAGRWLTLVSAFLALLAGAMLLGWTRRGQAEAGRALESYKQTRKAMDDADGFGDDPAAARRFLHERGKRSRAL